MNVEPDLMRRLIGRGWQILILLFLVSLVLALLIVRLNPPSFEAFSLLRVEPTAPNLFAPLRERSGEIEKAPQYLKTQVQLIKSTTVLEAAVANQAVSQLPMIKAWQDPISVLRKTMVVEIVPDTYIIRVALESQNAEAAATIVNAVVEAFRADDHTDSLDANRRLRRSLADVDKRLDALIAQVGGAMKALAHTARIEGNRRSATASDPTNKTIPAGPEPADNMDNSDNRVTFTILNQQLTNLLNRQDQVARNISQLDFQANQEPFRVVLIDKASVPKTPTQ